MKDFFILSLIFYKSTMVFANISPCVHADTIFRCVKIISVHDGDTFKAEIPNTHPFFSSSLIRLNGIDAPEITSKTPCEKSKAETAKAQLEAMLKTATRIDLYNIQKDKYFRIRADVYADGKNVSEIILKKHLARPYHGEAKVYYNWCKAQGGST